MKIEFTVYGIPRPGGSKTPFINKKTGKVIMAPDNKHTKTWRDSVTSYAVAVYNGPPLTKPLVMEIEFRFPRPKCHYGTGKNENILKASAPNYHTKAPDLTKLIRSTEDALKHILWKDDSQIVKQIVAKRWASKFPGAWIRVREVENG